MALFLPFGASRPFFSRKVYRIKLLDVIAHKTHNVHMVGHFVCVPSYYRRVEIGSQSFPVTRAILIACCGLFTGTFLRWSLKGGRMCIFTDAEGAECDYT